MPVQKVLLVDDDADIRKIAALTLRKTAKWDVELASSGPEALCIAHIVNPDVILLDVMMPGMDGPAVLQALQSSDLTAHIPVIFLTAKIQQQEVERYLTLGVAGVLSKPFSTADLSNQIKRLVAQHQEVRV